MSASLASQDMNTRDSVAIEEG